MHDLKIKIRNSGGINDLAQEFSFNDRHKIHILYAQNGAGKSSLAKAIESLIDSEVNTLPHFNGQLETKQVQINKVGIHSGNTVVFNSFDGILMDGESADITNFLANTDLQEKFNKIYKDIEERYLKIIRSTLVDGNFKRGSNELDVIDLISGDFSKSGVTKEGVLEFLIKSDTIKEIEVANPLFRHKNARYATLASPDTKSFLVKHGENIKKFRVQYKQLRDKSDLLRDNFSIKNISSVSSSLKKEKYFDAKHKIQLTAKNGENLGEAISDTKELDELIKVTLHAIINDAKELSNFNNVEKDLSLDKNIALKNLLEDEDTEGLLVEMVDFEIMKRSAWYSYLQPALKDIKDLATEYNKRKTELNNIIKVAESEITEWDKIIKEFKEQRFPNYPIQPVLSNKRDYLLGRTLKTSIVFNYEFINKDGIKERKLLVDKDLKNTLSTGEKRVFNLLQLIYEFKKAEKSKEFMLFVLDDIVDSFDYANKYGLVSYIHDMARVKNINMLVLTHNFDFFRLLHRRTAHMSGSWILNNNDNKIDVVKYDHKGLIEDVKSNIKGNDPESHAGWISLVGIARNLYEFKKECSSTYCNKLEHPSCIAYCRLSEAMHYRNNAEIVSVKDVCEYIDRVINSDVPQNVIFDNNTLQDRCSEFIERIAENITSSSSINLSEKTTVSLASRIIAEKCICKITGLKPSEAGIRSYSNWCDENRKIMLSEIIDVYIFAPEHIHINSFMYEPLIDVGGEHLINSLKNIANKLREL